MGRRGPTDTPADAGEAAACPCEPLHYPRGQAGSSLRGVNHCRAHGNSQGGVAVGRQAWQLQSQPSVFFTASDDRRGGEPSPRGAGVGGWPGRPASGLGLGPEEKTPPVIMPVSSQPGALQASHHQALTGHCHSVPKHLRGTCGLTKERIKDRGAETARPGSPKAEW